MKEIMGMMVEAKRTRRSHSKEFKAEVIRACEQPGVSIAQVSRHYGLNTNLVQTWLRQAKQRESPVIVAPERQGEFVAVACIDSPPAAVPSNGIRLEIRYRGAEVAVQWPVESASACAQWLREWLR